MRVKAERLYSLKSDPDERDFEEAFDELIDELYEPFKIGELEYSASWVWKNVDPTAYRIGLSEYVDEYEENSGEEGI